MCVTGLLSKTNFPNPALSLFIWLRATCLIYSADSVAASIRDELSLQRDEDKRRAITMATKLGPSLPFWGCFSFGLPL